MKKIVCISECKTPRYSGGSKLPGCGGGKSNEERRI